MLPTQCKMPDIRSECPPLQPTLTVVNIFFQEPDREFGQYRRLIVRWVDKALAEFDEARSYLLAQIEEINRPFEEMTRAGRFIYMFEFSYAMEQCLILTRRLLRVLDRIKGLPLVEIDRTVRRYLESQSQSLVDARNFSEHTVEVISGGEFPESGSLFARLTEDESGIEVGGRIVLFTQLAATLRRFYLIAQGLIDTQSGLEDGDKA